MIKRDFQPIYFSIDSKFMRALSNDIRFNHHRRSIFLFFVSFIQNLFFFLGLSIACGDVYRDTHKNFPAGFRIFCSRWMGAGTKPFFFTVRVVFHCWVQIRRHTDPSTHTPEMCVCVSPPPFFYVLLCSTIVYETERRERFFLIFVTILFFFYDM